MKPLIYLQILFTVCSALAVPPAIQRQAAHLRIILKQADEAYHNKHESIMTDAAYDALCTRYAQLVSDYPELGENTAVGAKPEMVSETTEHTQPILSLAKAYDDSEVEKFLRKCGTNQLFRIEPKIDGLTVVLRYHSGLLTKAVTRGNGEVGMDVTKALIAAGCAPLRLEGSFKILEVRGEVYIPHAAFESLNARRVASGHKPLKSPRNTASGTLRLHDYAEISRRGLELKVFHLLKSDHLPETHSESLALLESAGLPIPRGKTVAASEVCATVEQMNRNRHNLPFNTDGLVIKVESRAVFEKLGATSHHPRGALARKYKETPLTSRLIRIEWSKGEIGRAHV